MGGNAIIWTCHFSRKDETALDILRALEGSCRQPDDDWE